jgi:carboxymethylenebutenolidase
MCTHRSLDKMLEYQLKSDQLSRRQFGALSVVAGLASLAAPVANAADVKESEVEIKTPDGVADAHFVHPSDGRHPAVLVWPDIFGLRGAFRTMGKRLAESGYAVLTVNPFYRRQKAPTSPKNANFDDPATRDALFALAGTLSPQTNSTDAKAFISWLDGQDCVDAKRRAASAGYCMGGPITLRTAAAVPARVGAVASFHGAELVTDKPDSPHLLVPKMNARGLFAIAESDDRSEPNAKNVLRDAFKSSHRSAEIEVYPGTEHGWCPTDSQVYNRAQAERAWGRLLAVLHTALG